MLKMKIHVFAFLLLLNVDQFLADVEYGTGFQCYKCTDEESDCMDGSHLGTLVDCPPEADACLKAHAVISGIHTYVRSCGIWGDGKDGDCVAHGNLGKTTV